MGWSIWRLQNEPDILWKKFMKTYNQSVKIIFPLQEIVMVVGKLSEGDSRQIYIETKNNIIVRNYSKIINETNVTLWNLKSKKKKKLLVKSSKILKKIWHIYINSRLKSKPSIPDIVLKKPPMGNNWLN